MGIILIIYYGANEDHSCMEVPECNFIIAYRENISIVCCHFSQYKQQAYLCELKIKSGYLLMQAIERVTIIGIIPS